MVLPSTLEKPPAEDLRRTNAWLVMSFLRSYRLFGTTLALTIVALGGARLILRSDGSFIAVATLGFAGAAALAAGEVRRNRIVVLNLFSLAFLLRVVALTSLSWAAARDGGSFLGPDSVSFVRGATYLAAHAFHLGMSPLVFFGTYDVGHYYLFATAIQYLHADLLGLQMINASLSALAAPLTFSIVRRVLPRTARVSGLLVGLYPSLVVLSVVDLLKDPSVLCATLVAVWTVAAMARARHPATIFLVVPGLLAVLYLRTSRFYTLAYLEFGLVCATAWVVVIMRGIRIRRPIRTAIAGLVLMFAAGEAIPAIVGWPPSPVLFTAQVLRATGTPGLMNYSAGLVDHLANDDHEGQFATERGVLSFGANLVRRVMGPFPWIRPARWDVVYLEANNYLLYPGMLVWYTMLPVLVIGLLLVGRDILCRAYVGSTMVFLWLFTVPYCLQYLAINLSYRQRDDMFPFLLVFVAVGSAHAVRSPTFRRWYPRYWAMLALIAVAHLTVRQLSGL